MIPAGSPALTDQGGASAHVHSHPPGPWDPHGGKDDVSRKQLNLGIVAHVDAGKTTLTERLLFEAGVIDEVGSVDAGTTQTDTLELERLRGITIKSAVTSFALGDVHVNLIDTPGHPDFIAEVERVLSVLDGAVLVISAVEGVQPQTRILMRALQRLRIPTLLFVNKIDRAGAEDRRVLNAITERLGAAIIPLSAPRAVGSRDASVTPLVADESLLEALAENDEELLASYVEDGSAVPPRRLFRELASQTRQVLVHPVFFGSALTGAGVERLAAGIPDLLPSSSGDPEGPPSGVVFKIERGADAQKIAYVRMLSGTIRTRDRVSFGRGLEDKVTAIAVFESGPAERRQSVAAGEVAKLWGLREVQIGDRIGEAGSAAMRPQFPPPTLESVVVASNPDDRARLRTALIRLAEQDPLINVQQNEVLNEDSVSLYGEVQKEVLESTLETDYWLEVAFQEPTPIHIERPLRSGEAIEVLKGEGNPFLATIGLRVGPAPVDSGVEFRLGVDASVVPLYLYTTLDSFGEHMGQSVRETLREGLLLCGDDDRLRLQRARRAPVAKRAAQQELRLQEADADRAHAGARQGGNTGVRAGRPGAARGSDGVGRRGPGGHRPAGRARGDRVAAGRPRFGRHRSVGPRRAEPAAGALEADERRGRVRVDVSRLRAGDRRPASPAAEDREPTQPRGVPREPGGTPVDGMDVDHAHDQGARSRRLAGIFVPLAQGSPRASRACGSYRPGLRDEHPARTLGRRRT